MPESIEAYLQCLFQIVSQSPFVSRSHIELDRRGIRSGLVRGELVFDDGSTLYFRELVTVDTAVVRLMYSFHYQSEQADLIFRYDDTPHHRSLPGYPHHKHEGDERNVVEADPPDLAIVMREIQIILS